MVSGFRDYYKFIKHDTVQLGNTNTYAFVFAHYKPYCTNWCFLSCNVIIAKQKISFQLTPVVMPQIRQLGNYKIIKNKLEMKH